MRLFLAFTAGGLFGTGLFLSGLTYTRMVLGWLDVFGNWDPALAFVMGGAIIPMAIAWRLAAGRKPLAGGGFPAPARHDIGHRLITGSVLFGMGWGLAGLCPGPAMASLSYGGWGGALFLVSMAAGMLAAPKLSVQLDRLAARA